MTIEAITWALAQQVERSSAKFVLVAMANCANHDMTCWPSTAYLSAATCQDRKTVLENIKRLKEAGFISDLGERKGQTGQIVVYELNGPENGTVKESRKRNSPENGTVPKTDAKSPVFPRKESRFSVETVPKTGHGTVKEPLKEPSVNQKRKYAPPSVAPSVLVEAGFSCEVADEFISHKARMKAPLTARAWADHVRESQKAGWSAVDAAEKVMAKSWKGFEAKYVANERPGSGPISKQAALEARNRAVLDEIFAGAR